MNRGWQSSKLHFSLILIALTTGVFVAMGMPPDLFSSYCTFLASVAGIQAGTATAEKFAKPKPE